MLILFNLHLHWREIRSTTQDYPPPALPLSRSAPISTPTSLVLAMLLLALVLSCFVALAQATLSLTFPTNSSGWTSLIGPNQISWTVRGGGCWGFGGSDPSPCQTRPRAINRISLFLLV